jgi:hypothetical protein
VVGSSKSYVMRPVVPMLLGAVIAAAPVSAGDPPAPEVVPVPEVRYHDGRLTVYAAGALRADVLAAVEREAGISLAGSVLDARPVNKRFENVPLAEALDRLLGDQNFVLFYQDGRPHRVELGGLAQPRVRRSPRLPARRTRTVQSPRRPTAAGVAVQAVRRGPWQYARPR